MDNITLNDILKKVAEGDLTPIEAAERLRMAPYEDLEFAKIDLNRELRTGRGEVIFGQGKTPEHIVAILKKMVEKGASLMLATRTDEAQFAAVQEAFTPEFLSEKGLTLEYRSASRMIALRSVNAVRNPGAVGLVAVVTAGTTDIAVAEEAAFTAELYGQDVLRVFDVGVAGLHRLLDRIEDIRKADVVIAIAGMEGALASVLGGLLDRPVIAVPTSVGYGASLGGLTALFAMLNSCSLGVSVMNIDNGFGAGYLASMIAGK
ncbi:MAG: nickel pincer cofactor biosynthesis protein LarB [Clostridiales Family XIII bacterium]|jgi:NCAIR mutase (PurE)-related protein|nr:nickel pincer cofactor biosynthesis protein LarB [Clostridiales Family XIII bacterium]